jgi:hypothetical protein
MTKAQRNAIISPAKGLMVYQTNSTPGFYFYNGNSWAIMKPETTKYTAGQGISIVNGIITNLGDFNAGDDITINTAAGGDLVGNYPSPQVAKLQGVTIFPVAPTTNQVLKYNGSYWIPSIDDNTTYSAGNGLNLSGTVFTNTAPDQTVTLTGGGGTTVSGTYPNFTINSTDNDAQTLSLSGNNLSISNGNSISLPQATDAQTLSINGSSLSISNGNSVTLPAGNYTAGTGIDISGNTITNTAPTQWTVSGGISSSYISYDKGDALINGVTLGIGGDGKGSGSNTAVGNNALQKNTTGDNNTALGYEALINNSTGSGNTAIGGHALGEFVNCTNNTALGYNTNVGPNGVTNSMALGYNAVVNGSNEVVVGNSIITSIGGQVGWSTLSDGRFKSNIKQNVPGLEFINKLKPVTYTLQLKKLDKFLGIKDSLITTMVTDYAKGEQKIHTGFIAQDVERTAQQIGYDFDGVNHPQNEKSNYSLVYADFVPSLVKAVQELSKQNNDKDAAINDLKNQVNELKTMMQTIQQKFEACNPCSAASNASTSQTSTQIISVSSALLEQNIPNPFTNATTINYTLPQKYSSAKIIITDKLGKTLKEINVSGSGKGSLKVDASTLANGAYQYSLYVNNKLIASKQMILSK